MTVSVIVPHYNDLISLDRCLACLCDQIALNCDMEIIVADNASPCGVAEVERVVARRAKVVTVTRRGAGAARNGGVEAAVGQILAFTDCDCEPSPSWLSNGIGALGAWDIVGGKMVVSTPLGVRTGAQAFEVVFAFNNKRYVERLGFTVTANLFCSRAVFEAVGGFGVGMSEDVDWCRRARALKFSLGYCPQAECRHPARRNWADLKSKWIRIVREDYVLNYSQNARGRLNFLAKAAIMPASIIVHSYVIFRSNELKSLRERIAAIVTLARLRSWRALFCIRLALKAPRCETS